MKKFLLIPILLLVGCSKGIITLPDGTTCHGEYISDHCGVHVSCDDGRKYYCVTNVQVKKD